MCMDMQARIEKAPVIVLHFDCMRMGTGGVGFFKPGQGGESGSVDNNSGVYNPTQSQGGVGTTTTPSSPAAEEPPQVDYDVYDEVTEVKRPN